MRIGITGSTKTITKLPWFTLSNNSTTITCQYKNRFVIECVDSSGDESAEDGKIHWPVNSTYTIFTRFRNEHGTDNEIGLFSSRYYRNRDYDNTGIDGVYGSSAQKLASPSLIITTIAG